MSKNKNVAPAADPVGNTGTALVTVPSLLGSVTEQDEVAGAFSTGIQGQERNDAPTLPFAKIDHAEKVFVVSGQPQEALEGYLVHFFQTRAWWEDGYEPGKHSPPDCWSPDMEKPSGQSKRLQSSTCDQCPWSQFGSASVGKGQACKTQTFAFIVNPAFSPPSIALVLPPSSIKALLGGGRSTGYVQRAKAFKDPGTGRVAKYHELVWTRFSLSKVQGAIHCVLDATPLRVCPSAEEARALAAVRGQYIKAMETLRGATPNLASGDEAEAG